MTENLLSLGSMWLRTSSSSWAMDVILATVCGLVLFILLLPFLHTDPSFMLTGKKKNTRKHHVKKKGWKKSRKKSCILKACRECRKDVEETRDLALFLQSHLSKLCGDGRFNQLSRGDSSGEMFRAGPARANRLPRYWVEDPSSGSLSSLPSLASEAQHHPASILSTEPQEDHSACRRVPPGTVPQNSRLSNSYLASLITAVSDPGLLHCCLSFFSWWWTTAKGTSLSTWTHGKSQEEYLSHHSPDPVSWEVPTHWKGEVGRGNHSFIHPDVQKLLEMLISKRVKQKMCQEKQKYGSFFQPVNTDYPRVSLRTRLRSLGDKLTSAQPFCNTKGKPEWLLGSQELTFHKVLGGHLEHERSQLFWGLPSLHSESLIATAWVAKKSSSRSQSIRFNEVPIYDSGGFQNERPLQNLPPFLPYVQPPAQVPCFPPNPQPTSPSQVRACRTTCPTSLGKAQSFIPNQNQNLEWPLQKPLKWRKTLTSKLQKAQEAISLPSVNHPQGSQASEDPKSASILASDSNSMEPQKKPECHRPRGFITDEGSKNLPHPAFRFLASQDLMKPLGQLTRNCQGQEQDNHGATQPTQPSAPVCGKSKAVQKIKSWSSGSLFNKGLVPLNLEDRNVPQEANKNRKDASQSTGSTSLKDQGEKKDAESDIMRPEMHDSGSHFSRGSDQKGLRKGLQVHLNRKLSQISEGMIPVCVQRSQLAAKHTLPKSQLVKVTYSKDREMTVNTSQELAFLDPRTRLLLETHVKKYQLRHKWWPLFQNLEPRNIHEGEAQALPPPQPAFASPATCDSRADFIAKPTTFWEEVPGKVPGQKQATQTSSSTLQNTLPATRSPACKEVQRAYSQTLSDHNHRPTDILPPSQEVELPSAPCIQQSRTVLGMQGGSLVATPDPTKVKMDPDKGTARVAFTDTCHSLPMVEIKLASPHSVAKESRELELEKKCPAWEVTIGASMMENSQNININLRNFRSLDSSNHSSPSKDSIQNESPNVNRKVDGHFEVNTHREGENQSQDISTGSLQECHTEALLNTGTWPSQASLSSSQGMLHNNMTTSQVPCDLSMKQTSSLGQQEPSMSRFQDAGKSNSKISYFTNICKDHGNPRPCDEELFAGVRPSCARVLVPSTQIREVDNPGSKTFPNLSEKCQAPSENPMRKKMKQVLQCLNPNNKCKGQEDSLQRPKTSSALAQPQVSITNRLVRNGEKTKGQVLLTVIGQILVDKLGLRHGSALSGLNWYKAEPREVLNKHSCYHRASSSPDQRTVVKDKTCAHHASPKDHSHPVKSMTMRGRDSNQALLPREPEIPNGHGHPRPTGTGASGYFKHYHTSTLQRCLFSNT